MMMSIENPVQYCMQTGPVLEEDHSTNPLTPNEIHQLFSLVLESENRPSNRSTSSSETTTTTNRSIYTAEERKHRRMASNRESARRSRLRKKNHIENTTNEVNRLKVENRELKNLLSVLSRDCYSVERDSNRLFSESIYLQQKLAGLNQILAYSTTQLQ